MNKNTLKSLSNSELERVARNFQALSEVSRLRIVQALHSGEKSVSQLVELTKLSQPNVSRHLTVLVNAGLIGRRKSGLNVLYRITEASLAELCAIVCKSVTARNKQP